MEIQEFSNKLDLFEAIKKARKWIKHRKWLVKNQVNFDNFKEEIEFQNINEKFGLDWKA